MASKSKDTKNTKKTVKKKVTATAKKPAAKKTSAPKKTAAKKTAAKENGTVILRPCDKFYNRELSWLEFNNRILNEARDNKNPLLERLNFLAITASNLDEFYIVRVASLRDMASVNFEEKDLAGFTVNEQLKRIDEKTRKLMTLMYSTYSRSLVPSLKQENIFISDYTELEPKFQDRCNEYFKTELYPILTPMAVDQSRPFPLIYNRMLNLCVMLDGKGLVDSHNKHEDEKTVYATLQVPNVVPRLFKIAGDNNEVILVPVESIIRANLDMLFTSQRVLGSGCYRIMRNADLDIDEDEAEDLLKEIEEQVRKRRYGEIIRLEVEDDINPEILDYIITELQISKDDIFSVGGPIDLTFLSKVNGLAGKDRFHELRYPSHDPAATAMFDETLDNIFDQIRKKDRLVHHPYESFEPVLEFVKQAARDPNVLAIKQTLYRVSSESPIIASLLEAANNGKQVMVLVELKARFDEQNNINWAKKLENAGCHVIYGLVGLKTHSKITLVVRKEEDGIRRYLHLATGNYNDITARIYTDIGLFTASESFGEDASEFFNMLSGYSIPSTWRKLVAAPIWMKDYFVRNIRREAEYAASGKPARIVAKINSLVDGTVIDELYKASKAGVKIDLIIRGICCLKAGIPGLSENITVRSITGRFLEHSRIFMFNNGGKEDIYLASADWMPRNLDRRVELMFPIEDPDCRARIKEILEVELNDTIRANYLYSDGNYHKLDLRGKVKLDSQQELIRLADEAVAGRFVEEEKLAFEPAVAPE